MLNFQITTKKDLQEAAKIEKKRKFEEERKSRIFNARQRVLGIDYEIIEQQIAEKKKLQSEENEKERKYLEEEQNRQNIIRAKEKEIENHRRRVISEINTFRCKNQRKEDRREFDLYDPEYRKKSKPQYQTFDGEDLDSVNRKREQKNQQRAWLEQQIREKEEAKANNKRMDKIWQETAEARERRTQDLYFSEQNKRNQIKESIANYNKTLAEEQNFQTNLNKQKEQEDNLAEIYNNLSSTMLTENPETAQSALGPKKKIGYMSRGMGPKELAQFRLEQDLQRQENCKKKNDMILMETEWDQLAFNLARHIDLKDREVNREIKSRSDDVKNENIKLATEQNLRKTFMNQVLNTNNPTNDYFAQFNTTTR